MEVRGRVSGAGFSFYYNPRDNSGYQIHDTSRKALLPTESSQQPRVLPCSWLALKQLPSNFTFPKLAQIMLNASVQRPVVKQPRGDSKAKALTSPPPPHSSENLAGELHFFIAAKTESRVHPVSSKKVTIFPQSS